MESGAQVPEALGSPRMGMAGEIHSLDRSGGTAAPHRPQNLWPIGTGVEHDLQTKFFA